jgi:PAS domain S-box-containing protein
MPVKLKTAASLSAADSALSRTFPIESPPVRDSDEIESERQRFQKLLELAPAAIGLLSGPDHRWIYVNDFLIKRTGRKNTAEFIGRTVLESLPEIEEQGFLELLDEVFHSGIPFVSRELKVTLGSSTEGTSEGVYFDFVCQPMRDAAEQIEGIFVHGVDVTDKVLARRKIVESEERFRQIFEITPECVQVVAPDGTLIQMNSAGLALIGASKAQDVIGKSVYDLIAPEYRERFRQFHKRICEGERGSEEFEITDLSGKRRYMESHAVPLSRPDGNLVHLAITRDVTDRRMMEQALRESEENFRNMAETAADAIFRISEDSVILFANPACLQVFRYSPEEVIGQNLSILMPESLREVHRTSVNRYLTTGKRHLNWERAEVRGLRKDRKEIIVELSLSEIVRNGRHFFTGFCRDVTERKQTEKALRRAEKFAANGQLAAVIAHEVNNPLQALSNLLALLAYDTSLNANAKRLIATADLELTRMSHITRQMLSFYTESVKPTKVNITELIKDVVQLFASRIRSNEIEIIQRLNFDGEIYGFLGELRQLLANLMSNAIEAIGERGRVTIHSGRGNVLTRLGRHGVRISIGDTGPGIERDLRECIFEPFFTTKAEKGTGLGLWVVKGIVAKHQGIIRIRSHTVAGRSGTVFSVLLPADVWNIEPSPQ